MPRFSIVFVTAPPGRAAAKIARTVVEKKLAACVNIVPAVRSVYRWKGKIEEGGESLLIMKTRSALFARLERAVRDAHPYDVPEIVAFPLSRGHRPYFRWLDEETKTGR
ncbi:MAG: divalent-cation tolerance protein CutA [Elusimicrobia bacterium]|nr:divalent-cation tolerance protein CutA [Elusimicrobiota bacterium]